MNFTSYSWTLPQAQLNTWVRQSQQQAQSGRVPTYISHLEHAHPTWFAAHLLPFNGTAHHVGRTNLAFSLMSIVKPFVLLYLLEQKGAETIFKWVGTQPSDHSFNSISQLRKDQGFPRNPMLNSGAIALMSLIPGQTGGERCSALCQWIEQQIGVKLTLDQTVLTSVRQLPNERNRALAHYLAQTKRLSSSMQVALDAYEQVCCLSVTVESLARLGMLLVDRSLSLKTHHQRIVTTIVSTCGLYEESGKIAVSIGVPIKSGVSGAVLAVIPNQGAIACYSPPLNAIGNSLGGLFFLEKLSQHLNLSVFS